MPLYWRTIIQIRHMMFVGLVCCDFGGEGRCIHAHKCDFKCYEVEHFITKTLIPCFIAKSRRV